MKRNAISALATALLLATGLGAAAFAEDGTPSEPGATVYFINLEDGATVSAPVTVQFGLSGMGIAPSGVEKPKTGHHHLFLNRPAFGEDAELGADEATVAIIADDNHIHYGGGQTETTLELAPGTHTLQLVLGDYAHIPHVPPVVSERITITVE